LLFGGYMTKCAKKDCSKFCDCKEADKKFCKNFILDEDKNDNDNDKDKDEEGETLKMQDEEPKTQVQPAPPAPGEQPQGETPGEPSEEGKEQEPTLKDIMSSLNSIKEVLSMLIETDKAVHTGKPGEGEDEEEEEEPDMDKENSPKPVAMQKMQARIDGLEKTIMLMQGQSSTNKSVQRLKNICSQNPDIDFSEKETALLKFQSEEARKVFLDYLETESVKFGASPAMKFLAGQGFDKEKTLSKFQNEPPKIRKFAEKVLKDYQDSIAVYSGSELVRFQAVWKSADDFVNYHVEQEKANPGFYEREAFRH